MGSNKDKPCVFLTYFHSRTTQKQKSAVTNEHTAFIFKAAEDSCDFCERKKKNIQFLSTSKIGLLDACASQVRDHEWRGRC